MGNNIIICDGYAFHKGALVGANNFLVLLFKFVSYHLRDNFVDNIVQTNESEIVHILEPGWLFFIGCRL